MAPSGAAQAKDPRARVQELLGQFEGDRKKAALAMKGEGFGPTEIGQAFKQATGEGISGRQWGEWKLQDKQQAETREVAVVVLTAEEKAFATTVAAKLHAMNEKFQAQVIDLGLYVYESVTPLVPADTAEEKVKNTKEWLQDAVAAFDPEATRELEKFGALAFYAAQTLKMQMSEFMAWADPSTRLQEMAEKALYSPNPVNKDAFNVLMLNLMKSIHAVPRFERKTSAQEFPEIVQAFAQARGIKPEDAEEVMTTALKEELKIE
jgi:hypothetical protein